MAPARRPLITAQPRASASLTRLSQAAWLRSPRPISIKGSLAFLMAEMALRTVARVAAGGGAGW